MKTRDLVFIALMTAVVSVLAQIAIPLPFTPVPFTLQVFGVALAGLLLSPGDAFLSMLVYIFLGAVGIPVFAQFEAGLAILTGPKGGFLISFPLAAYIISLIASKRGGWLFPGLGCLAGLAIIYLLGAIQLSIVAHIDMIKALELGTLPFIPFDVAKVILATLVARPVKKALLSLSS
ncbi:MAG: biotin transporter BioY [Thermoanaerobacteraceae bacterium]|nr:biotin transporter BioY [Thermoanaerobacteraceae bacterium]